MAKALASNTGIDDPKGILDLFCAITAYYCFYSDALVAGYYYFAAVAALKNGFLIILLKSEISSLFVASLQYSSISFRDGAS